MYADNINYSSINCNTMGNFDSFDERYYIMESMTKKRAEKVVEILCKKFKNTVIKDKKKEKTHTFTAITEEEVWYIVKKYCSGFNSKDIANYIISKREEQYKSAIGLYATAKIKFPTSRIQEVIKLLR